MDGAFNLAVSANLITGPISLNLRDISIQTCLISLLIASLAAAQSTEIIGNKESVSKIKILKTLEHLLK